VLHYSRPSIYARQVLFPSSGVSKYMHTLYLHCTVLFTFTDINDDRKNVQVAFCVYGAIIHKWITKQTVYFHNGGQQESRTQFPLQNSFALTVHKTQGLTLPCVSLALDQTIFSAGQAYVALNKCPKWEHVQIMSLHKDAFKTDPEVTKEYNRFVIFPSTHVLRANNRY